MEAEKLKEYIECGYGLQVNPPLKEIYLTEFNKMNNGLRHVIHIDSETERFQGIIVSRGTRGNGTCPNHDILMMSRNVRTRVINYNDKPTILWTIWFGEKK